MTTQEIPAPFVFLFTLNKDEQKKPVSKKKKKINLKSQAYEQDMMMPGDAKSFEPHTLNQREGARYSIRTTMRNQAPGASRAAEGGSSLAGENAYFNSNLVDFD